ncbi:MAG TPA: hypothetical protein VLW50_28285 [Streptosporangiaceae bacterium]|nr:hypothetical protein [Streptosporangiaceae bacterium]
MRRLAGLLAQPLAAVYGSNYDKPVWHCSIRAAPEDRLLSDAEWARVAAAVMDRTDLAPEGDDRAVRWVAVRHASDHIHLVATLACQDRIRPKVWNDFFRVREACRDAERRFGLRSTAPADRTGARRASRAEAEQATRRGWAEPRVTLRREVCTAAAGARTEEEFFARLAHAGVLVRRRYSTRNAGEVTGYAVGLPQHTDTDGQTVWYGGGKLAADLTLPKLRTRWAGPPGRDPLAGAAELPPAAVRAVLRAAVSEAAGQVASEADFFARLRAAGVLVQERFSEVNPGEVTGYAVTLPGCTGPDGTLRWYGGGRLHDRLTLPRLRDAWAHGPRAAERSGAFRFTAAERTEIYRHAGRQAAAATEHLRHCTVGDPGRGADAAWAAADTLHTAARALRSPVLRCAADRYDRAARAQFGRIPHRTGEGDRLRGAARLLAMSGANTGDGTGQAGALVASLMKLLDEVAGLREAQAHAAQAAAARQAAQQLHAAFTQARGLTAQPGQVHVRPRRPGPSPGPRSADFPIPLAEVLAAAAQDPAETDVAEQVRLPPARPGPPADPDATSSSRLVSLIPSLVADHQIVCISDVHRRSSGTLSGPVHRARPGVAGPSF